VENKEDSNYEHQNFVDILAEMVSKVILEKLQGEKSND